MANAAIDSGDRPVTVTTAAERVLDTRSNLGLPGRFADATPRDLQITGSVPVASGGSTTVVPDDTEPDAGTHRRSPATGRTGA